jgi:hypothetical protein
MGGGEEDGTMLIRAVQGHSTRFVDEAALMEPLTADSDLPEFCVHGTYYKYLDSILMDGLNGGSRRHIHFAVTDAHGVGRDMRHGAEVGLWLDLPRAMASGIPFFRSLNGIILSPGVNGCIRRKFWKCVTDLHTGIDVPARVVRTARSRSRSSRRRLVHHNSPHKNVFGPLPEIVECMCWAFGLKALGNMLETRFMLRSRWNKKCFQHVPKLPNKCTQHMLQQFPVVSLIVSCAVACNPQGKGQPSVRLMCQWETAAAEAVCSRTRIAQGL